MNNFHPHKIELPGNIPEEEHEDVIEWLVKSVKHYNWDIAKENNNTFVCFSNLEDAVAFKVVWYSDDDN